MKSWVSENLAEMIALIALAVSNIWSYARLTFQHLVHGRRLEKIEGDLERHTDSGELHRNLDFERRFEELRKQIVQINIKLDRLIERRN